MGHDGKYQPHGGFGHSPPCNHRVCMGVWAGVCVAGGGGGCGQGMSNESWQAGGKCHNSTYDIMAMDVADFGLATASPRCSWFRSANIHAFQNTLGMIWSGHRHRRWAGPNASSTWLVMHAPPPSYKRTHTFDNMQ